MQAAVAGLAPGSASPVQIGACRALAQVRVWGGGIFSFNYVFPPPLTTLLHCAPVPPCARLQLCQQAQPAELVAVAPQMFAGLCQLLHTASGVRACGLRCGSSSCSLSALRLVSLAHTHSGQPLPSAYLPACFFRGAAALGARDDHRRRHGGAQGGTAGIGPDHDREGSDQRQDDQENEKKAHVSMK